jgi:hypothetical protein
VPEGTYAQRSTCAFQDSPCECVKRLFLATRLRRSRGARRPRDSAGEILSFGRRHGCKVTRDSTRRLPQEITRGFRASVSVAEQVAELEEQAVGARGQAVEAERLVVRHLAAVAQECDGAGRGAPAKQQGELRRVLPTGAIAGTQSSTQITSSPQRRPFERSAACRLESNVSERVV